MRPHSFSCVQGFLSSPRSAGFQLRFIWCNCSPAVSAASLTMSAVSQVPLPGFTTVSAAFQSKQGLNTHNDQLQPHSLSSWRGVKIAVSIYCHVNGNNDDNIWNNTCEWRYTNTSYSLLWWYLFRNTQGPRVIRVHIYVYFTWLKIFTPSLITERRTATLIQKLNKH